MNDGVVELYIAEESIIWCICFLTCELTRHASCSPPSPAVLPEMGTSGKRLHPAAIEMHAYIRIAMDSNMDLLSSAR
jgi:hypothetical protein